MNRPEVSGGIDEVGWGALAGPIISVVAVLREVDIPLLPPGVRDSKKTTEAQRGLMYPSICRVCTDIGVGHAWPWEIDQYGPGEALQLSYRRAMEDLTIYVRWGTLYVDGNSKVKHWKGEQVVEPKADNKYKQVSAASIVAKHIRDRMMIDYALDRRRQGLCDYGWEQNKGYGTQDHMDAIKTHGLLVDANDSTKNHSQYLHRLAYTKRMK